MLRFSRPAHRLPHVFSVLLSLAALPAQAALVLDLGGKGDLDFAPQPVAFDLYGTGEAIKINWPVGDTGFLVLDLNHNGVVDSGVEMFGDAMPWLARPDRTAEHGFAALAQYDADRNGTLDAHDPIFANLRVWTDKNADGKSQPEELTTLAAHQIVGLSVGFYRVAKPGEDGVMTPLLMGRHDVALKGGGKDGRVMADLFLKIHAN